MNATIESVLDATEIYTLSLHDALPISPGSGHECAGDGAALRCWRLLSETPTTEP